MSSFLFRRLQVFFFGGVQIGFRFRFYEGLFLKIEGSRILLNQGDQLLIELIKILQASDDQDHLRVKIRFGL